MYKYFNTNTHTHIYMYKYFNANTYIYIYMIQTYIHVSETCSISELMTTSKILDAATSLSLMQSAYTYNPSIH